MTDVSSNALNLQLLQQHIEDHVQRWYVNQLGHPKVKVACHVFDNKLMIVLDNAVTQPERLLVASGRLDFAEQVRTSLDRIFRLHLQQIIETLTRTRIVDLLTATQLETERTSIVAILSAPVTCEHLRADLPNLDGLEGEHADE